MESWFFVLHSDAVLSDIWHYYSFKIFSHFWLVKTTCIIHHNQLLFTKFGKNLPHIKVHLTPNTISAKMQTWSCSKSNLTFFRNIWNFSEQHYNLKFDILFLMSKLVKGMGLFSIWRHKLFCMHVHKELMPCKWVCDVKSRIEPGPC